MADKLTKEQQMKIIRDAADHFTVNKPYRAGDIPFQEAKKLAIEKLGDEFGDAQNGVDLENLIKKKGSVLFIKKNYLEDLVSAVENESQMESDVEAGIDCEVIPPPEFDDKDIENVDEILCHLEPEARNEDPVSIEDIFAELDPTPEIEASQAKVEGCLAEAEAITERIKALVDQNKMIRDIIFPLEESLWLRRIAAEYYKERVLSIQKYQGIFEPLILEERRLTNKIDNGPQTQYDFAIIGDEDNIVRYRQTDNATPRDDTTQYAIADRKHPKKAKAEADRDAVRTKIDSERDSVSQFDTSVSETVLYQKLNGLISGSTVRDVENAMARFANTNRIELRLRGTDPFNTQSQKELGFTLIIDRPVFEDIRANNAKYRVSETIYGEMGIDMKMGDWYQLIKDTSVTKGKISVAKIPTKSNDSNKPHGLLYDQLYNIMGEPNEFFSDIERGSTSATPHEILNEEVYDNFWSNFNEKLIAKKDLIEEKILEPAIEQVLVQLRELAHLEAKWQLNYGRVWEQVNGELDSNDKPNRLTQISTRINRDYTESGEARDKNEKALEIANLFLKQVGVKQKEEEGNYAEIECNKSDEPPCECPSDAGTDPHGLDSYKSAPDPQQPDVTKFCYWKEFAKLATKLNILPIPTNSPIPNPFRYWPVGLIVPTPAGPYNIPLPIIWKCLACIPTPLGIFVVFIGLSGVIPAPFVLYIGTDGDMTFIVSLKGPKEIKAITGVKPKTLPTLKLALGIPKLNTEFFKLDIGEGKTYIDPDSAEGILNNLEDRITKKVNKLDLPGVQTILDLDINSSVAEKREVLSGQLTGMLEKLNFDGLSFPKDKTKLNPDLGIVKDILGELSTSVDLKLPSVSIPELEFIDLKAKLTSGLSSIKDPLANVQVNIDLKDIDIQKLNPKIEKFKADFNKIFDQALEKIGVDAIGIFPKIPIGIPGNFLAPFTCTPAGDNATLIIPPAYFAGIQLIKASINAALDVVQPGGQLPPGINLKGSSLTKIVRDFMVASIPDIKIPNPSSISIKNMITGLSTTMLTLQKPVIPKIGPIVVPITIPGAMIGTAIAEGVNGLLSRADVLDRYVDLLNNPVHFNPSDLKRILSEIIEEAFETVRKTVTPIINLVSALSTIPELNFLKLPIFNPLENMTLELDLEKIRPAFEALALLAGTVGTVAVATMGEAGRALHPLSNIDNLPPWERLSLNNLLFVVFLDQFCSTARKSAGFQEQTLFPSVG